MIKAIDFAKTADYSVFRALSLLKRCERERLVVKHSRFLCLSVVEHSTGVFSDRAHFFGHSFPFVAFFKESLFFHTWLPISFVIKADPFHSWFIEAPVD